MKIEKQILGLAGKFAIASELCKRSIYVLLFIEAKKSNEILLNTKNGMLRIIVRTKQIGKWPNCEGIYDRDTNFSLC